MFNTSYGEDDLDEFETGELAAKFYADKARERSGWRSDDPLEKKVVDALISAQVVERALARGGAVGAVYMDHGVAAVQAALRIASSATHQPKLATPQPFAPPSAPSFADRYCGGDVAVARSWDLLVREVSASVADQAPGLLDIADCDWSAWTDVPLPSVFAFPKDDDDDRVRLRTLFKRLCEHVHLVVPLYTLATLRLSAPRTGSWTQQRLYARQAAASWRICRGLGWTGWLRQRRLAPAQFPGLGASWVSLDDDAIEAFLDRQVDAADAVGAFLDAHVRRPAFVEVYESGGCESNEYAYWLGGLSPSGNIVGALTTDAVYDSDLREEEDDE